MSDDRKGTEGCVVVAKEPKAKITIGALGKKIKFDYPPLRKWKCEIFPAGHISAYICGASGCGKSTLFLELLPNFEDLTVVCYFTLIPNNPVIDVIKSYCDDHEIEFAQCDEPLTGQKVIEDVVAKKPKGTYGLVVFDDFVKQSDKVDSPYKACMSSVLQFLRNESFHNVSITQSPATLPSQARNNINLRFIFKQEEGRALRVTQNEFSCTGFGPDWYFHNIYDQILRGGKFSYMCIVSDQDNPRIYVHLQNRGENHLQQFPTFEQYCESRDAEHQKRRKESDSDEDELVYEPHRAQRGDSSSSQEEDEPEERQHRASRIVTAPKDHPIKLLHRARPTRGDSQHRWRLA